MQTMAVAWNGTTLNDKVKLLSKTEIGNYLDYEQYFAIEGNRYYIQNQDKNCTYYTRTRYSGNNSYVVFIDINYAGFALKSYTTTSCLAPAIRLGVPET